MFREEWGWRRQIWTVHLKNICVTQIIQKHKVWLIGLEKQWEEYAQNHQQFLTELIACMS